MSEFAMFKSRTSVGCGWRRYGLMLAATLLFVVSAGAQSSRSGKKSGSGMGEYDEIIIKKKTDAPTDKTFSIEISGEGIRVNGKPIEEFEDEDFSVRKRSIRRFELSGPGSPFRQGPGEWRADAEARSDLAFLGVTTEGSSKGTKILTVSPESPADKAGLKQGDIIRKFDGKDIFDHEQLTEAVRSRKPGDEVELVYIRGGKESNKKVRLGNYPGSGTGRARPGMPMGPWGPFNFEFGPDGFRFDSERMQELMDRYQGSRPRLGIRAQDTEDGNGVKVLEVEDDSPAEKAGIREGDLITSLNGKEIKQVDELSRAVREARDQSTLKLELRRNGKKQQVDVRIPKKLRTAEL